MALASLLVRIGADLSDLNKALDQTDRDVQRLGKKMSRAGQTMTLGLTVPIVAGFALAFKASEEQAQSMAKLNAVIGATGGEAGVTAQHVDQLASRLQKTTTFADDVTMSAAATLLTFKSVRNELGKGNDVFDRTIIAAQDMATIFGGDLQQSTVQLAKAIENPIRGMAALRRVGVTFSDSQTAVIKALQASGDKLGAQKMILQALETQFGGTAAAMSKTAGGQMKVAMNALSDSAEKVGVIVAPMVMSVAAGLANLAAGFQSLSPETQKTIVAVTGLVATIGPLLLVFGKILTLLPLIKVAFIALTGPIGLTVAAIVGLTVIWLKWGDDIKRIVRETITAVKVWLLDKFTAIVEGIRQKIEAITGFFKGMYEKIVGHSYIPDLIDGIAEQFARLDAVMVTPALRAAGEVNAAFAGLKCAEIPGAPSSPSGSGGGATSDSMGAKIGRVFQAGSGGGGMGQMVQAVAEFGPLAALLPVINGAMEKLGPAFTKLIAPLVEIGSVIGEVLAPVFKMLAPVVQLIANAFGFLAPVLRVIVVVFSYVSEAIGFFIKALGMFVDKIIPDFISHAGKGWVKVGQEMIDAARAARRNTDATDSATDATNKFASALSNVPRVLNINALRHMVTGTPSGGGGGGSGGGSGSGGGGGGGGGGIGDRPLEMNVNSGNTYYITVPGSGDPERTAEAVGRAIERTHARGGMSRIALAVA